MKYSDNLFLTDDEIKVLSIYLAYGIGLGVFIGLFLNNIDLYFALGGVISILVSLFKIYTGKSKKTTKVNIDKL